VGWAARAACVSALIARARTGVGGRKWGVDHGTDAVVGFGAVPLSSGAPKPGRTARAQGARISPRPPPLAPATKCAVQKSKKFREIVRLSKKFDPISVSRLSSQARAGSAQPQPSDSYGQNK
jgi:hypothetical protein